jgi:hypothetical protein
MGIHRRETRIRFEESFRFGEPSRTPPRLRRAMVLCTWFMIAYHAWETLSVVRRFREIWAWAGPFAARVTMGPPIFLAMFLGLWFRFFRHEREGARVFALALAFLLFCATVVVLVHAGMGTARYPFALRWGLPVCVVVYLLYGIAGRERMP